MLEALPGPKQAAFAVKGQRVVVVEQRLIIYYSQDSGQTVYPQNMTRTERDRSHVLASEPIQI